ncbi:MAG: hypothetical protein Salg2KO_10080 [Salibacteraceae bacterium]
MNEQDFEQEWQAAVQKFEKRFEQPLDLQAILFLIGVNELGKGPVKLSKDQKIDVMHIAVCQLLSPFGYYHFQGLDADGWPHYERNDRLPKLEAKEQEILMKEAIINYSREW